MSGNKHPKSTPENRPTQDDLERNPGIGQSKGTFSTGEDPENLEGVNTSEGDTDNEASPLGGVSNNKQRENR